MKTLSIIALTCTLCSGAAFAQANGAVNTDNTAQKPAASISKGANSFTEAQARDRLGKAGYTSVDALKLDQNGIWTGTATKGGQKVTVMLDYKGGVSQQ